MEERYLPSEKLAKLAVRNFRIKATVPLLVASLFPHNWILDLERKKILYGFSVIGLNAIANMQNHLEERFYSSLEILSARNVVQGVNPTLIASYREKDFEPEFYWCLKESLGIPNSDEVLSGLKRELSDYVAARSGFSLNWGNFSQKSGNIYFEDKRRFDEPPERKGRAIVVG